MWLFSIINRHPATASSSDTEKTLNDSAQLQTFPYPTVSKSFISLNGLLARSCSETLPVKSMKDKQKKTKNIHWPFRSTPPGIVIWGPYHYGLQNFLHHIVSPLQHNFHIFVIFRRISISPCRWAIELLTNPEYLWRMAQEIRSCRGVFMSPSLVQFTVFEVPRPTTNVTKPMSDYVQTSY